MPTPMIAKLPDEIAQMIYKQVMEETLAYFIPIRYHHDLEDGIYKDYDNGNLQKVLQYKDGHLHGTCTYYDKNGRLQERSQWKNGKRDGICIRRYARWKKCFYRNGERVPPGDDIWPIFSKVGNVYNIYEYI